VNLGTASDNTFTITDNSDTLGAFNLAAGTNVEISSAINSTSATKTFTIAHATPTSGTAITVSAAVPAGQANSTTLAAATSTATTLTIPVVTGLSKDTQGHVTAVTA
jgi:hypothetical protein